MHMARQTQRPWTFQAKRPFGALLAALVLVSLTVLPATAATSVILLSRQDASPSSGTPTTPVTFTVMYRNSLGLAPTYVRVAVAGDTLQMSPESQDWTQRVRFTVTAKLPVGTWTPEFSAADGNGASRSVTGPKVTIAAAPTPTPKPTPTPTPKPTPTPTPKPTPTPTAKPTPTPTAKPTPKPTPAPTAKPTPKPTAKPTPKPTAKATAAPTAKPRGAATPAPAATRKPTSTATPTPTATTSGAAPSPATTNPAPSPEPTASAEPGVALVVPGDGSGGSGTGGSGGTGSVEHARGTGPVNDGGTPASGSLGGDGSPLGAVLGFMPVIVITVGGVAMLMAFLLFGKRRRDGEPTGSDDVLAASAALGMSVVPVNAAGPALPAPSPAAPVIGAAAAASAVQAAVAIGPAPQIDGHLPRWRRPSLMEARKADPLRSVTIDPRLTFDGAVGDAVGGLERRRIRYRLVSLLDLPDEVRGVEIGNLDQGDEVVLMEKRGTYWRVLCPDGREGWLHKMTLGAVVSDAAETAGGADDGPPTGGFEDMLRAYTEGRHQFGEA